MSQTNTNSLTQTNKTWELTPYELQRTPQEVITDNTEIAVSPRSLHSELMCPICLDMLRSTMTTKECLHRFCAECITTALRSGNKECPTCRKKLVSRRSLRPDPNFDALIAKIYPSRDEYEAQQEKVLQTITKHHNPAALANSIEEGLKLQAVNRNTKVKKQEQFSPVAAQTTDNMPQQELSPAKPTAQIKQTTPVKQVCEEKENSIQTAATNAAEAKQKQKDQTSPPTRKRKTHEEPSTSSNHTSPTTSSKDTFATPSIEDQKEQLSSIDLELFPHPDQVKVSALQNTRFVKTSSKATVEHLSQYIALRIALEKRSAKTANTADMNEVHADFNLFIAAQDKTFKELNFEKTLEKVREEHWKLDGRMQIYFLKKS